ASWSRCCMKWASAMPTRPWRRCALAVVKGWRWPFRANADRRAQERVAMASEKLPTLFVPPWWWSLFLHGLGPAGGALAATAYGGRAAADDNGRQVFQGRVLGSVQSAFVFGSALV